MKRRNVENMLIISNLYFTVLGQSIPHYIKIGANMGDYI